MEKIKIYDILYIRYTNDKTYAEVCKVIKKSRKTAAALAALLFFGAITAAGCIIERVDKDAFIEESVVSEDDIMYIDEGGREDDGLININTADAETLTQLDGIGDALAGRIRDYRETHGGFGVIEEIMNVPGISESKFEDIKDDICAR